MKFSRWSTVRCIPSLDPRIQQEIDGKGAAVSGRYLLKEGYGILYSDNVSENDTLRKVAGRGIVGSVAFPLHIHKHSGEVLEGRREVSSCGSVPAPPPGNAML